MKNKETEWFESWFDTNWYHMLYCDRDESEASQFIQNLFKELNPPAHASVLDLACGKGRHSQTINDLGYKVWGVDLSEQSINHALTIKGENLSFAVHDMRKTYKKEYFDIIVNLFTSFGYFNSEDDNLEVMKSVWEGLKPNGIFVMDFLNAQKVKSELVSNEIVTKEGIEFRIKRRLEDNVIVKEIYFESEGNNLHFEERVTAFEKHDLESLFTPCNLIVKKVFGDYNLNPFNAQSK